MNQFYIITNKTKDKEMEITHRIQAYIEKKGKKCKLATEGSNVPDGTDCILVVGGDGTFIRAARELMNDNIPLLGINMGRLGYLTEAEVSNVEESLDKLIDGETEVEERMMLRGSVIGKSENIALNDIVLTRSGALRLIEFNLYVNGEFLNTYRADGLIVSTPTGSTAYNISAGGPIVEPTAEIIVVTPICSHALNASSIVLSAKDEVMLEIGKGRDGGREEACVCFDGESNLNVSTGDRIVIQKASNTTKIVKLSKVSFLEILRKKMKGN
jgi:NAD+ kinase